MAQQQDDDDREATSELMYVSYARELQLSEQQQRADENGPLRRINRAMIYYMGAYCCNLDLQADRPESQGEQQQQEEEDVDRYWLCAGSVGRPRKRARASQRRKKSNFGLVQSKWKRQLRFGWIPRLVLASYFVFVAYLLIVLYHQYSYDFDLLRLRKLQQLQQVALNTTNWTLTVAATREIEIGARMSATKSVLNLLDPDYSHLSILVECFYLSIVVFVTIIYLSLFLHYRFQRPFDYHIIRDLLDRQRENANIRQLVERQVFKFIESSRVFHENLINCDTTLLGFQEANLRFVFGDDVRSPAAPSATFRREHELNQMVREMLASGALTPLYNTSAWLKRRTKLQFTYHMALIMYAVLFDISLTVGFFSQTNPDRLEATDSRGGHHQSLTRLACLGLLICAGPSVALHAPIFMVVVLEQLSYLKQLRAMIKRCVRENSLAFARRDDKPRQVFSGVRVTLNQSHSAPNLTARNGKDECEPKTHHIESNRSELTKLERTMNGNLIFLILHYKIFIAQLLPIKRSLGFVNVIALVLLFIMPIISRIHEPYLSELSAGGSGSHLSQAQLKIFTILMSSSILVPANLTSGPLCFMFARCEDLYRDLTSLVAHISEVKSHSPDGGGGGGANIYDSHAECCLLKELSDSKCLLEQLTVRAGNISGTYTVLVRAHFWYGLIAISNLVDSNYGQNNGANGGELLSSLFSDPLGVYSEMK